MKHFTVPALVVIIASCWFHAQAMDNPNFQELVHKAIPIAEKILNEDNIASDDAVESRFGRQFSPFPTSFGGSLINILLQLLISIKTNCAFQPYNLPSIPSPNTLTCANQCRTNPTCTHFTYNGTSSTCHRASSLISLTANIQITLLPTTEKCHCGYLLDRASPSGLLSLNAIIGALIA